MKNRAFQSRRGSYLLEGAVVMPVIILAIVTAVLIIMFFFRQMTEQSKLHIALRSEAGGITGKTIYLHDDRFDLEEGGTIHVEKRSAGSTAYGKKYLIMKHAGILSRKGIFVVEGSSYGTNGPRYVRYCNVIKGGEDE